MTTFLDTQVISKAFKGIGTHLQESASISSIVANEFLLVQHRVPTKANYYVRRQRHWKGVLEAAIDNDIASLIDHPASKRSTDALHMDFGGQFPTIIEFNSLSLSHVINHAKTRSFSSAVRFLPSETSKLLIRRFKFIVESGLVCVPIVAQDVQLGFFLLRKFIEKHEPKKNFRNTWNDILILASAINRSAKLITEDTLLSRFTAEQYSAHLQQSKDAFSLTFPSKVVEEKRLKRESKGYINTSWRVYEERMRTINGV